MTGNFTFSSSKYIKAQNISVNVDFYDLNETRIYFEGFKFNFVIKEAKRTKPTFTAPLNQTMKVRQGESLKYALPSYTFWNQKEGDTVIIDLKSEKSGPQLAKLFGREIDIDVPFTADLEISEWRIKLLEGNTKLSETYDWSFEVVDWNFTASSDNDTS
jgi:hypothetical protein